MAEETKTNGSEALAGYSDLEEARALERQFKALEADILLARSTFFRQAGITFNGARDEYAVLGYDRLITNGQYRAEYLRGGLAGRVVDVMPDACWRGDPPMELIEDEDPDVDTPFEKAWQDFDTKMQACSKLHRLDKLSRLSQFACLLLGAKGELETELPRADKRGLLYLMPFSGGGGPDNGTNQFNNRIAYDFGDCSIFEYDTDPQSERFGLPKSYQLKRTTIASPAFGRPVHWSRIIHAAEGVLDDDVYGLPALERIWNLLIDLRKVTGGGAEAFWLRANQGLHLDIDKDMGLADAKDTVASLKEQAEAYKHQLTRFLRTRGVTVETLGSDVANFSNPADTIITQIAGAKAIPKRILTGSEMGELASSQDRDNWRDQVIGRQQQHCAPNLARNLADRLITYGYLPEPQKGPLAYQVSWKHSQVMTEAELVAGAQGWADVNQKMGLPVFTADEVREKWAGKPPLTDDQKKQMIADKEAATPAPPPPAPGAEPAVPQDARAAEDAEMVRVLAAAIDAGNTEVVERIIGLGDIPGHEFHGNQHTSAAAAHETAAHAHETAAVGNMSSSAAEKATKDASKASDKAASGTAYVKRPDGLREHNKETSAGKAIHAAYQARESEKRSEAARGPQAAKSALESRVKYHQEASGHHRAQAEEHRRASMRSAQSGPHTYGTTQVQLPPDLAEKLFAIGYSIPTADLYEQEGGRETDAHITVCYGLQETVDEGKLHAVLARLEIRYAAAVFGKTAVFETPDYDVVYVTVDSPDLERLNNAIDAGLPVRVADYPKYVPHATVAYVKAGRGQAYAGLKDMDGATFKFDSVVMVTADGARTEVRIA